MMFWEKKIFLGFHYYTQKVFKCQELNYAYSKKVFFIVMYKINVLKLIALSIEKKV